MVESEIVGVSVGEGIDDERGRTSSGWNRGRRLNNSYSGGNRISSSSATAVECDWSQRNGGAHTREQETDKVISIEARKFRERNDVVFLSSIEGPSEIRGRDIVEGRVVS